MLPPHADGRYTMCSAKQFKPHTDRFAVPMSKDAAVHEPLRFHYAVPANACKPNARVLFPQKEEIGHRRLQGLSAWAGTNPGKAQTALAKLIFRQRDGQVYSLC